MCLERLCIPAGGDRVLPSPVASIYPRNEVCRRVDRGRWYRAGHVCDHPSILCPATALSWNEDMEVLVLAIGMQLDPHPVGSFWYTHWAAPLMRGGPRHCGSDVARRLWHHNEGATMIDSLATKLATIALPHHTSCLGTPQTLTR